MTPAPGAPAMSLADRIERELPGAAATVRGDAGIIAPIVATLGEWRRIVDALRLAEAVDRAETEHVSRGDIASHESHLYAAEMEALAAYRAGEE